MSFGGLGGSLTLGPDTTLNVQSASKIGNGLSGSPLATPSGSLVNHGAINVSAAAGTQVGVANFSNDGTITAQGTLQFAIGSAFNTGSFTNALHGTINFDSTGGITVYGSFDNEGAINASGPELLLALQNGGTNNGAISVAESASLVVENGLTGTGSVSLASNSQLGIVGGVLANTVNFSDHATLVLAAPGDFAGTLSGLTDGDQIEFVDAIATSAFANGTTLTVNFRSGAEPADL